MELLIGIAVGSFLTAVFVNQARWGWRLVTGGYLFKDQSPPKPPVDPSNP